MTNMDLILKLENYAIDPTLQFIPGLTKTLQFAAWRLRDYQSCENELRRHTGAESMREVVDKLNGGGDGRDEV